MLVPRSLAFAFFLRLGFTLPAVSEISDGQPQASTAAPISQISDGQPQAPTATPVSQISDGQPQAPTGTPVTQISDGQPQATATSPAAQGGSAVIATLYSDGQYEPSATIGGASVVAAPGPTAVTKNGTYAGYHLDSYNEDLFLGIPYAQPPTGPLRFRVPQSINSSFEGIKTATEYYPACIGYGGDDIGYGESEDCLALNVIRPSGYEGQALPVGMWIHGGGLQMGSGGDERYNLSFIVQNSVEIGKPIMGVSINYRLAGWGFLTSLQVQASGQTNLGIRDQRLAMHWVQENIAAFGGDPTKVTIWGESSGAASVGYHLTAYGGRDDKLFRAGIMESGGPFNTYQSDVYYQPKYDGIVNATGCNNQLDTLECLRMLDFETLNAVLNTTMYNGTMGSFDPVLDGDILQSFGSIQLAAGKFVAVPIIDGANTDEGTAFGPKGVQNESQFLEYLTTTADDTGIALPEFFAKEILAAYPDDPSQGIPAAAEIGDIRLNATYGERYHHLAWIYINVASGYEYRRTSAYAGDTTFIANRRLVCETWAAAGVDAYCYRFNVIPYGVNVSSPPHPYPSKSLRADHRTVGDRSDPLPRSRVCIQQCQWPWLPRPASKPRPILL